MKESRDILVLFEALNNHEIFTPPKLARQMLELLPDEVWTDPNLKFLDPCTKSGIFLRESFYKLYEGLKNKGIHKAHDGKSYNLNDDNERINHILKNMLYGIATSELTGYVARRTLYGVMEANTDKQIAAIDSFLKSENYNQWSEEEQLKFVERNKFNEYYDYKMFNTDDYKGFEEEGNIFYPADEVAKKILEDGNYEIEDTYYPFINEETKHQKILDIKEGKMKFDVIIGNPPYQMLDGGAGASAKPIYHKFIQHAKKINPTYLTMIIPSRWFAGGKGLDAFREEMLNDKSIKIMKDFVNAKDCFPGISIGGGVCYFLRDKKYKGECSFTSVLNSQENTSSRLLNEYPVFVRYNDALNIIKKIKEVNSLMLNTIVSSRNPFGLSSFSRGEGKKFKNSIILHSSKGIGYITKNEVTSNLDIIDSYKVMISKVTSEHAGEPDKNGQLRVLSRMEILGPNEVCTDSYLILGNFKTLAEAENLKKYLKSKFLRFLLVQAITSINLSKDKFCFVPSQNFKEDWNDSKLYKSYNLSEKEISFIESLIREYR